MSYLCPIYVKVNDSFDLTNQTKQDDINKKWTTEDFIRLYSRQGIPFYVELNNIILSYPNTPIKVIIASAAGLTNQVNGDIFTAVRRGEFTFLNNKNRLSVELEMDEIKKIHEMMSEENRPQNNAISMHIGLAYLWMKSNPNFDKSRFFDKILRNQHKISPQAGGTRTNRRHLCELYNQNLQKESSTYIDPSK